MDIDTVERIIEIAKLNGIHLNFFKPFDTEIFSEIYPIHYAIHYSNMRLVSLIIENEYDCIDCYKESEPCMDHYIIDNYNQHSLDTQFLIDIRCSPLTIACAMGNYDIAKLLLENGADINYQNIKNQTALMYSVMNHMEIISDSTLVLLLDRTDINPDLKDINGNTALIISVIISNWSAFRLLLGYSDINIVNNSGKNVLYYLAKYGFPDEIYELPSFVEIIKESLDIKFRNGLNILMMAIKNKNIKFAKFLINNGIDINYMSNGKTALDMACDIESLELINRLINAHNIKTPENIKTVGRALIRNIHDNKVRICKILLKNDIGIDYEDKYGDLPLHHACANLRPSNIIIIKKILSYSTIKNLTHQNIEKMIPLMLVILSDYPNRIAIIKLFWDLYPNKEIIHHRNIYNESILDICYSRRITEALYNSNWRPNSHYEREQRMDIIKIINFLKSKC